VKMRERLARELRKHHGMTAAQAAEAAALLTHIRWLLRSISRKLDKVKP